MPAAESQGEAPKPQTEQGRCCCRLAGVLMTSRLSVLSESDKSLLDTCNRKFSLISRLMLADRMIKALFVFLTCGLELSRGLCVCQVDSRTAYKCSNQYLLPGDAAPNQPLGLACLTG